MKLFKENGLLSEYGQNCLDMFLGKELNILMNSAETHAELNTLKCVLSKYLGDKISDRIAKVEKL